MRKSLAECLAVIWMVVLGIMPAAAQQVPIGDHYAARESDSGFGSGTASPTGTYRASLPIQFPSARGGLPLPLQLRYVGNGRVGDGGVDWAIQFSYVVRSESLMHRRPQFDQNVTQTPKPKSRVVLVQNGAATQMIPVGSNGKYRPIINGQQLLLTDLGENRWVFNDGAGRAYYFEPLVYLPDKSMAVLTRITDRTGLNEVRLSYLLNNDLPAEADGAFELLLDSISYNHHPESGCAKHKIKLHYGSQVGGPKVLSYYISNGYARVRTELLNQIEVLAVDGNSCSGSMRRLYAYQFEYQPDLDTALPRLVAVDRVGQTGTPEEIAALPVARYEYGAATDGSVLRYVETNPIAIPPEASNVADALASTSTSWGTQHDTRHALQDFTGDGLPDLVFPQSGVAGAPVLIARNVTDFDGTTLGSGTEAAVPLFPANFPYIPLAQQITSESRYYYHSQMNIESTWVQNIDINGDGRLDILDARFDYFWHAYINLPGPDGQPQWVVKPLLINEIREQLIDRGMQDVGASGPIPLSRSRSGQLATRPRCARVNPNGEWVFNCPDDPDFPVVGEISWNAQHTIVEWKLADVNGDGYPDFVANSQPTDLILLTDSDFDCANLSDNPLDDVPVFTQINCSDRTTVDFPQGSKNQIEVSYNQGGAELLPHGMFSKAHAMPGSPSCGLEFWPVHSDSQVMSCGLVDINGDNLLDRVVGVTAYLGTGDSFTIPIELPGVVLKMSNTRRQECDAVDVDEDKTYFVSRTVGLVDLTGDGIPDYVSRDRRVGLQPWQIWIGTGVGFREVAMSIEGKFLLNATLENCDSDDNASKTVSGLFDVNGDGRLDLLTASAMSTDEAVTGDITVHQIRGRDGQIGALDAGRLTRVTNGAGASTLIKYESAKKDATTAHQVPFAEIVVAHVRAEAENNLGSALELGRFAYGGAQMVFDPTWDVWTFRGYQRSIALRGLPIEGTGTEPGRIQGSAAITDRLPGEFPQGMLAEITFKAFALTGRVSDVYSLDGKFNGDPWDLLAQSIESDARLHSNIHYEYRTESKSQGGIFDCTLFQVPIPPPPMAFPTGLSLDSTPCSTTGFVYPFQVASWRGESAPPSDKNLAVRTRILSVDDFGRILRIQHDNDVARLDDDICEEVSYANSVTQNPILDALHTWQLKSCGKHDQLIFAGIRYRYDDLPEGQVATGLRTHRIVEVYDVSSGAKLDEYVRDVTTYDARGNATQVKAIRGDGVERIGEFSYDPFALAMTEVVLHASDVTTEIRTTTEIHPLTLKPLATTDPNNTVRKSYYDGYGRRLLRTVLLPDRDREIVLQATEYAGDDGAHPDGIHVKSRVFHTELPLSEFLIDPEAAGVDQTAVVTFFDDLGRPRYAQQMLGADYGGSILIINETTYDRLGRIKFEADPYLKDAAVGPKYGTTFHYRNDDSVGCIIRGRGPQLLNRITSKSEARFPACSELKYADHRLQVRLRGPNEMLPGSSHAGVFTQGTRTAIGLNLETSTWKGDQRLELSEYSYDQLGQMNAVRRYQNATPPSQSVNWFVQRDSLGRVIRTQEPATAARTRVYDAWDRLRATRWDDAGVERETRMDYDGFNRLVQTMELANGVPLPETVAIFSYDVPSGDPDHLFAENLIGRLTKASNPRMTIFRGYDSQGRIRAVSRVGSDDELFAQTYGYRVSGLPDQLSFLLPDNDHQQETVQYSYDSAMRTVGVDWHDATGAEQVFKALEIDPFGNYNRVLYGNTVEEHYSYNTADRQELEQRTISTNSGDRVTRYVAYDGDLRSVQRTVQNTIGGADHRAEHYQFDALNRLARSEIKVDNDVIRDESYGYDGLGNLTSLTGLGVDDGFSITTDPLDRDRLCDFVVESHPIAPTAPDDQLVIAVANTGGEEKSVSEFYSQTSDVIATAPPKVADPGTSTCQYRYDVLGNVIRILQGAEPPRLFAYDGVSRITSMSRGASSASFRYGPFGEVTELNVVDVESGDSRHDRRYGRLAEKFEILSADDGPPTQVIERRVPGPFGILMARRGPGAQATSLYWHGDGTANRIFTDAAGAVVQDVDYSPFGSAQVGAGTEGAENFTKYLWNGGDTLKSLGVVHLGARLYDPVTSRFLQRDPLIIPSMASESHPYAFAFSDPVNLSDPLGLDPLICSAPEVCGPSSGTSGFGSSDSFHWPIFSSAPTGQNGSVPERESPSHEVAERFNDGLYLFGTSLARNYPATFGNPISDKYATILANFSTKFSSSSLTSRFFARTSNFLTRGVQWTGRPTAKFVFGAPTKAWVKFGYYEVLVGGLNYGLNSLGAPEEISSVTGVLAETTSGGSIVAGFSGGYGLITEGPEESYKQNLRGQRGGILQGYTAIADFFVDFEGVYRVSTSDAAERGELGTLFESGNWWGDRIYDYSHTDKYTLNPLDADYSWIGDLF